jgi:hypothetical protein
MLAGRSLVRIILIASLLVPAKVASASSSGSFAVTLRGAVARTIDGRREMLGLLAVDVPLDRIAAPRRSAVAESKRKGDKAKSIDPPESPPEAAKVETPTPIKPPVEAAPLPPPALGVALASATMRAAFRASGRQRTERRFDSLSTRARASAVLPELRLRAGRTTDESMRYSPTVTDPYRYTQAGGVTVAFEAQATWRLDRLVFADEEIDVEQLRRHQSQREARLVDQVLKALFDWQRAVFVLGRTDVTPEEQALAALRLVEAEVKLDILTGGWFSVHAPRVRRAETE